LTASRKRIGVFGGAFDPPHQAHLALATTAMAQLQLDELRVLPTGQAWHKARDLSPAEHRLAMVRLAFADLPGVVVDDRETRRAGPSYTVDSLREIQAEQPGAELFLLIGEDQARALATWHDWQTVVQLAIICVAARAHLTGAKPQFMPQNGLGNRFLRLEMPSLTVSATEIRSRFAAHQSVAPLVCEPVARYIDQHHLYQIA
jgi:nicotinate-nucleotide adenylyltransferase